MRVFQAVVEAGSFAGAADRLDLSRGMATKYVAALERQLNVRLLYRTTRKLALTEAGADYAARVAAILAQVDEASAVVSQLAVAPSGTVRVTASVDFGQRQLGRLLSEFHRAYPGIQIDLTLNNQHVDLLEEGFDLALWTTLQRNDERLVARTRIARIPSVLAASPGYLAERGVPQHPADLASHNCLHHSRQLGPAVWTLGSPAAPYDCHVAGSLSTNNNIVLIEAAREGLGIILQPRVMLQDDLQEGRLVELLPEWEKRGIALYALYPSRRFLAQKVKLLIDFLEARLQQQSRPA